MVSSFTNPDALATQVVTDLQDQSLINVPEEIAESPNALLQMYLEAVREEHRWLRILGQNREVEMNDLYLRLRLSEQDQKSELESALGESVGGKKHETSDLDIRTAVSQFTRVVVIGDPGCGKTTSLRHLAYVHATENLQKIENGQEPDLLPIYLPLGVHGSVDKSLTDYLWDVTKAYALPLSLVQSLEKHVFAGRALLLIDGVDEVPTDSRRQVVRTFEGLMKRFPSHPVAITSRVIGFEHLLPGTILEVKPLSQGLIEDFIHNWFAAIDPEKGAKLWQQVSVQSRLLELAENPFPAFIDRSDI